VVLFNATENFSFVECPALSFAVHVTMLNESIGNAEPEDGEQTGVTFLSSGSMARIVYLTTAAGEALIDRFRGIISGAVISCTATANCLLVLMFCKISFAVHLMVVVVFGNTKPEYT
jgi:hypothetical protein